MDASAPRGLPPRSGLVQQLFPHGSSPFIQRGDVRFAPSSMPLRRLLDPREQRRRQPGVLARIDRPDLLPEPEGPELLSHELARRALLEGPGDDTVTLILHSLKRRSVI